MSNEPPTPEGPSARPTVGNGRYEMQGLLGRGGMADVSKAKDLRLGRTVAIKRLRVDLAEDPTFQARFRREAQSAASLNHPSIVAVYDTGEETAPDGSGMRLPYIVMEVVEGRTLRDILREGRKILPERALEIVAAVLNALDYSHRAGIIHRDIKPANVMLTPTGDVKVMDFGIARAIADSSATMTQTAAVVGTAQYLSPEQARGEQVDARSDLYSAGCLLYELLTGRPPFVGDSPVSVAYQHVREEPDPPSTYDPEIPPEIDAITLKSLTKPVDQRYQSAAEMRSDIERALEGRPVLAPAVMGGAGAETEHFLAPTPTETAAATTVTPAVVEDEPRRRRRWLWVLLALLVAALIAALIVVPRLLADDPVPQSDVPRLQDKTVPQARRLLERENLEVGAITRENSSSVERGLILNQSETPGDSVDEGTEVDLVVSAGTETRTVPDVTSLDVEGARQALEEADLRIEEVRVEDSTERRDEVVSQDPAPAETVPIDTTVTVTVSEGFIEVPRVVGRDQDEAEALLSEAGFNPVVSSVEDNAPEGTVVDQNPGGGSRQPYGETVVIDVSLGPEETTPTTPTTPTETTPTETTPTETTPPEETTTPPETTQTTPPTTPPTEQTPGSTP